MSKSKLVILDANVVLVLFELGIWDKFIDVYEVQLPRTVLNECPFWQDDLDVKHYIDWGPIEASGKIKVVERTASEIAKFKNQFSGEYFSGLHPGECEALTHLFLFGTDALVISADAIVFRVLGRTGKQDRGLSLEEALQKVGLQQGSYLRQCQKSFRLEKTKLGEKDLILGNGMK